jgi:type IV pilus assembly protein PilY1
MKQVITCIIIVFAAVVLSSIAQAADTDIYSVGADVTPNVLIIFDNSGSMGSDAPYVYTTDYTPHTYDPTKSYERQCIRYWWIFCLEWGWVEYGLSSDITDDDYDGRDDNNSWIRTGNRLNYELHAQYKKIDIAKEAVKAVIDETWEYVRIGIMLLNGDDDRGDGGTPYAAYHTDNSILDTDNGGAPIMDLNSETDRDTLKGYIDKQTANGYTPLANRMINAALYFEHSDGTFGNFGATGGFTDPIDATYWCRENYIILMTDGLPTAEGDTRWEGDEVYGEFDYIEDWLEGNGVDADCDGDGNDPNGAAYATGGSDYLDDVAKYLYDTDLRPTTIDGVQNITTYVIGFSLPTGDDDTILEQTAVNGGGEYYIANTVDELSEQLISALVDIIERSQTFTAPVVPVQRTTSGDIMYVSLFTPKSHDNFWPGYLVKLKIGDDGELLGFASGYGTGDPETPVTDEEGTLDEDLVNSAKAPYPYWDAHNTLKNRATARNIYTYTGTSVDLDNSSNLFVASNSAVTATMLDNPAKQASADAGTTAREDLINYIHGADAYDDDVDSDYSEKRENILGDILHSQPLVIDYASDPEAPQRVIFVGTNDGILHAFDDTDGAEKWGFIPPDLLPQLKDIVEGPGHQYFVDGSPKAYTLDGNNDGDLLDVGTDQVIIVLGERRGGTSYSALDVTDPDDPQYLWRIDNANSTITGIPNPTTIISEMGQSWSEPATGKVQAGTVGSETDTIVTVIGGGYNEDDPHTKGRGLFIINALTGALVKGYTVADSGTYPILADMTYCIPSMVLTVDTNYDGYINRVYVGDTGGQLWRFGFQKENAEDTGREDGNVNNWSPRLLLGTTTNSPIFYPPDLVLEPGYAYIYFGTGDRENPCTTSATNRLFAVKDRNENDDDFADRVGAEGKLVEGDLVDLTENLIQDGSEAEAAQTLSDLETYDGWYITMEGTGEKILAAPVVVFGMVLFTTFVPNTDPCSYGGDGYLYIVDYLTGVSELDFNEDGDLTGEDRSVEVGHGIPTEPVITINADGDTVVYVGAGGGIFKLVLPSSGGAFNIESWREVFD